MNSRSRFYSCFPILCACFAFVAWHALSVRAQSLPDPDGLPANMSKPVQVYILMGQSNMLGFGKPAALQGVAAEKYPYLVDDAGAWTVRKDVRNVRVMCSGNSPAKDHINNWMTIQGNIGPEIGIGHYLGEATDAPVLILKSCIGNRSLGWDLLPPGSEPYEHGGKMQPGYRGTPDNPKGNGQPVAGWYAGCQYDGDVAAAKQVLANLGKYYPGATQFEVAGFFWWQGDKDMRNPAHYERYAQNLVQLIRALRNDFNAPEAKFVAASLGQTKMGSQKGDGIILEAMQAVAASDLPELKGKVAFVYTNPLSKGGSSSGHYGGNPETYMNVGQAMGQAMVGLLGASPSSRSSSRGSSRGSAGSDSYDVFLKLIRRVPRSEEQKKLYSATMRERALQERVAKAIYSQQMAQARREGRLAEDKERLQAELDEAIGESRANAREKVLDNLTPEQREQFDQLESGDR